MLSMLAVPAFADTGAGVTINLTTTITGGGGSSGGGGSWYSWDSSNGGVSTSQYIPQSSSSYIPTPEQPVNIPPATQISDQSVLHSGEYTPTATSPDYTPAWILFWVLLIVLAVVIFAVYRDYQKKHL
jgi:hypothetical protein